MQDNDFRNKTDAGNVGDLSKPTDYNDKANLGDEQEIKEQFDKAFKDDDWDEIKPIKHTLSAVEPFPEDMLPLPLRAWCNDISHRMGCPLDYVVVGAIATIGSLIGSACGIRPKQKDDWLEVPNLWCCIVGSPSRLKTPALSEVIKPLKHLEDLSLEKYKTELADYLTRMKSYKAIEDRIINAGKNRKSSTTCEELSKQLREHQEPEKPCFRRYKTNDATIEKLGEILSQNPRGLLVSRDELMGLLSTWDKDNHESDRGFYLEAWNGQGSHTSDRIGRGTTHIENLCVSILGGTQPSKLLRYVQRAIKGTDNDGLMQRFQLMVYPDDQKFTLVDVRPNEDEAAKVTELFQNIASMDFTNYGAIRTANNKIPYFHFEPEAQELFYEWVTLLQGQIENEEGNIIGEHLAKYRKLMPALALIFHVIDIASGNKVSAISLANAEMAAGWCEYLELHAHRIYGLALNSAIASANGLTKKIKKKELEEPFTLRDLYRKGWTLLTDQNDAENACDELVKANWLREYQTEKGFGQKGTTLYHINPKVWDKE